MGTNSTLHFIIIFYRFICPRMNMLRLVLFLLYSYPESEWKGRPILQLQGPGRFRSSLDARNFANDPCRLPTRTVAGRLGLNAQRERPDATHVFIGTIKKKENYDFGEFPLAVNSEFPKEQGYRIW